MKDVLPQAPETFYAGLQKLRRSMNRDALQRTADFLNKALHLARKLQDQPKAPARANRALRQFWEAVTRGKQTRLNPVQTAALHHLDDVLSWDDNPQSLWQTYSRIIQERVKAAEDAFPQKDPVGEAIRCEHHNWQNAVTAALLVSEEACLSDWKACCSLFKNELCKLPWPDPENLHHLFDPIQCPEQPPWKRFQDYVIGHHSDLERYRQESEVELRQLTESLMPRNQLAGQLQHILVVEDDPGWQEAVTAVARDFATTLGHVQVRTVGDCTSAREFVQKHSDKGVLAICDIGLPERSTGKPHEDHGWTLIQDLSQKCRVLALTSRGQLDRSFAGLGYGLKDFLLKAETETWRDDLLERLRERFTPLDPLQLQVIVPSFDASRIFVGGIPVPLKPLSFAVVDALAFGFPELESAEAFFALQPRYWKQTALGKRSKDLTLKELKTVMCRREVTELKADFMDELDEEPKRHEKQIADCLRSISESLKKAFSSFHLDIDGERFINVDGAGKYRLAGPALICETPDQFFWSTQAMRGPFRILIVEDNPDWQRNIHATLARLPGCDIRTAATYEEATDIVRREAFHPHLVSLDLEIPRKGVPQPQPENGVDLRNELTRELTKAGVAQPSFVVMTSHDLPTLRRKLARMVDLDAQGDEPADVQAQLRLRVDERAMLSKNGEQPLQELFLEAWRVQQECRVGSVWPFEIDQKLHDIEVALGDKWGLRVDGRDIPCPSRKDNLDRDRTLLQILAQYSPLALRKQAIFDFWAEKGLLRPKDMPDPGQLLKKRILSLRESIEAACKRTDENVLQSDGDGYRLLGNIRLVSASN